MRGRGNASENRFASGDMRDLHDLVGLLRGQQRARPSSTSPRRRCRIIRDVEGRAARNSIIGGASLWVMGGKKPEEYKGIAKFFTFLSEDRPPGQAASGIRLPADHKRRPTRKTVKDGFYEKNPTLQTPLKETDQQGADRKIRAGLRFGNMGPDARYLGRGNGSGFWPDRRPPREALDAAVSRGNAMLRTFEKTVK